MKRIISILAAGAILCGGISAYAADVSVYDLVDGIIRIKGTTAGNENINVLILNPGQTPENAENDASLQQFSDSITADENGNYTLYVKLKEGFSGNFPVYIKEGSNAVEVYSINFSTMEEKIEAANNIIEAEDIKSALEENKEILSLDIKIVTDIDLTKAADMLEESLESDPLVFDISDPKSEENTAALNDLITRIKTFALIESYNQGKLDAVYSMNEIQYDDIIGLSGLEENGITSYKLFCDNMTDEGKNLVIQSMLNKNFESVDDIAKAFTNGVMFYGISYNKEVGYGHIDKYITEENVSFAKRSSSSVSTYIRLSDSNKQKVNAVIKRNQNSLTLDNYLDKINAYAKDNSQSSAQGGGDYGGGNGSGNTGGGGQLYAPSAEDTVIGEDITEQVIFDDIGNVEWAKEAIEYLNKENIINGVGDKQFAPSSNLTREQAAKIICLAFKIDVENEESDFEDVIHGSWYESYVQAAKKAGVINGIDDKNFGVGANITREDLAVMLYRTLGEQGEDMELGFNDSDEISDYAKEAVAYLSSTGKINGYDDGSFKPKQQITRAEAAQLIYNIIK